MFLLNSTTRKLFYTAAVLIASTFITLQVAAQTSTITGKVTSENGPVENALILAGSQNTNTDINGSYLLSVTPGTITVEASLAGYHPQKKTITVEAGQTTTVDFVLESAGNLNEVVVVGSRNPGRSSTESPVPVDVIPLKQIANQVGQLDVNQLLTYLAPSFNSVRQSLGDATDHIDPAQLRGLGPDQVLVLVNGKRYHQTSLLNVNGTVNKGTTGTDLNSIPASSIERIEILRDGASAQYGSDAIAGVINIVLKKTTGLSINASYGGNVTSYDKNYGWNQLHPDDQLPGSVNKTDGQNFQVAANYGVHLKKGYLVFSAEYLKRNASNRTGLYTGQIWPSVNGVDRSDSINGAKGVDRSKFDFRVGNSEITSGGGTVNFAYPINDHLEVYAFGLANFKDGVAGGFYRYPNNLRPGGSIIPSTEADYDYQDASALLLEKYPYGFLPLEESKVRDYSITGGIRGSLGAWKVDLSQTYGANSYTYLVSNSANYTQAYLPGMTADALQTEFNSGKTKLYQAITNLDVSRKHDVLYGLNTALGAEFRVDGYGLEAGELNSYANLTTDNGLQGIAGAQVFAGFLPSNAGNWNRNSFALYSDNELDITKNWLLAAALRYEHFSDFGSTLNYKVATRYKFTDWLALRAAASSGFRAPSLQQEHYSKVTTLFVQSTSGGGLVPTQSGTFPNDSKIADILGIPKLKQETSHSYSVGLTVTPGKGLNLTVDAYQIDIKNRIILSNAFSGGSNAELTQLLNDAGAGTASVFANAIDTRSRGIESVLSYTKSFGTDHHLNISLAHSYIENKVRRDDNGAIIIHASEVLENSGQVSKYFNRADQSRIETYSPRTKAIFTAQYRYKKAGVLLRFSYFGSVQSLTDTTGAAAALAQNKAGGNYAFNAFDGGALQSLDQKFGGKTITDLTLSYYINRFITVSVGANNLFDVYPDKILHSGNSNNSIFTYSRAVSQFGFNGRYVFGKLLFNLP
ncbi:hypothetical protein A8C56_00520 [Niabella ginsenosidivorans]|uniref:TonB-dependent receptor n=2 Tax=Niabella ginsenosidivorans TaxID=1176587 RepID=A0A1A9HW75_9BACT|nr:hypothetical protein A8C56_00520 [Niabella ginsenosidivorans]